MSDNIQSANQAMTIFEPQNVKTLAQLAPQSYNENLVSHNRCFAAGSALLLRTRKEEMSDALDVEIAHFLEKAKLTVKKMNSKRTPVTQLFDQIRRVFTSLENDVDPAKADSIPAQLQAVRNAYARKKHEEEERRRQQEAARLAKENATARYRADVEEDYIAQFNALVNNSVNDLNDLDRKLAIDNSALIAEALKVYQCELPEQWPVTVASSAHRPAELTPDECRAIQANVMSSLVSRFKEQYAFEVRSTRDDILDRLPSKVKELQRIADMAKKSAEEADRIKAEMEAKEKAEAARRDAERREREKQEAAAAQLAAQKQEMDGLFGMPTATAAPYQPKTQVKKKLVIETADDVMKAVAFWWSQEAAKRSVDELAKEFRKQINFANAAANSKDNPMFITDARYIDDVKAK